jgi:prevent-host-death family protein
MSMKKVTAADANRHFSSLLKDVSRGERILVTSHGEPVAAIISAREANPEREQSFRLLMQRLRSQAPLKTVAKKRDWTRGDLYERAAATKVNK